MFLGLQEKQVGQTGGGKRKPNGLLDVAMIQSIVRKGSVDDIVATYGHVIVDECHHLPAVTFERVLRRSPARFVLGLTATPYRRDGLEAIITMQCGPIRCRLPDVGAGRGATPWGWRGRRAAPGDRGGRPARPPHAGAAGRGHHPPAPRRGVPPRACPSP